MADGHSGDQTTLAPLTNAGGASAVLAQSAFQTTSDDVAVTFLERMQDAREAAGDAGVAAPATQNHASLSSSLPLFQAELPSFKQLVPDEEAMVAFLKGDMNYYSQAVDAVLSRLNPPANSAAVFYGPTISKMPSVAYLTAAMYWYDEVRLFLQRVAGVTLPTDPIRCNHAFVASMEFNVLNSSIFGSVQQLGSTCLDCLSLRLPFVNPLVWTFVAGVILVLLA